MSDREALGEALHEAPSFRTGLQSNLIDEAAYERLAQLPEKCGTCEGTGKVAGIKPGFFNPLLHFCPTCHGSGKVYPAELRSKIAATLREAHGEPVSWAHWEALAVAVLVALNGETE